MKNRSIHILRLVAVFVISVLSTTLVKAQGGPLDGGGSDGDTTLVPVKLINLSVSEGIDNVTISWNTIGETQLGSYTLEKSENGSTFSGIFTTLAKNTASASYHTTIDKVNSASYFRIKATDIKGGFRYSPIKYFGGNKHGSIKFFPNPLIGNTLHISSGNLLTGKYKIVLCNTIGQRFFASEIEVASTVQDLKIGKLPVGSYNIIIFSGSTIVETKALQVN